MPRRNCQISPGRCRKAEIDVIVNEIYDFVYDICEAI